jgi:NAD-dependent SIR2 family protein deacetylase
VHPHEVARACLGFESGVGDFRREAGAWNMVVGLTSKVQLAKRISFVNVDWKKGDKNNRK